MAWKCVGVIYLTLGSLLSGFTWGLPPAVGMAMGEEFCLSCDLSECPKPVFVCGIGVSGAVADNNLSASKDCKDCCPACLERDSCGDLEGTLNINCTELTSSDHRNIFRTACQVSTILSI
ncbi:hypothetical protein BV898_13782 [Hypsibius exemplaris]|uniref:IGFBP N-terminal domain-containing protein n=1 Tax=Hypsibius exemplaris TaxID=2072580 RepID=A0A1W0W9Q8_HYPEX|nr:hypothetical protein BV898_13782 [Hypsibius exemplaris]